MSEEYTDPRIETRADGLRIRHYYLPFGDKTIGWEDIRSVRRVEVGALRGRFRICGTANPRYWANLDPGRPRKKRGFILDLGGTVRPFVTPDDPGAFEAALQAHIDAPIEDHVGALIV